jgi:hypothetical protein
MQVSSLSICSRLSVVVTDRVTDFFRSDTLLAMDSHKTDIPQPTGGDHAHVLIKAALSAIPVLGSPAAELFAAIIVPPLARRRDAWLQSLADGLAAVREEVAGFQPESLTGNEAFISATMQASRAALQTHHAEKLDALRNALLNIAIGRAPDEDQQAIFLEYVETLSTWHIRILRFFQEPIRFARERGARTDYLIVGSPVQPLEAVFPELCGRRDFYDQIVRDLHTRGLMSGDEHMLHTMMTGSGVFAKRTTELADRFLAFIASPLAH